MRYWAKVVARVLFVLALSSTLFAQTTQTQTLDRICTTSSYKCSDITFTGNLMMSIIGANNFIAPGVEMIYYDSTGAAHFGSVTAVPVPPKWGIAGPIQLAWATSDGHSGSYSGYIQYAHYRQWIYAIIKAVAPSGTQSVLTVK